MSAPESVSISVSELLALFTIHHRVLAQAAAEVGSKLEVEERAAAPSAVA